MSSNQEFYKTPDGSIVTLNGEVVYFSIDRFIRDICLGGGCYICGIPPGMTTFNDEHVIPDWLLREFNMHSKLINLPNGTRYLYDRYKISCCARCNSLLGERIEKPVSSIIKGGFSSVIEHIKNHGSWLLFTWLNLIFLKTHLRDREFRWHLDSRRENVKIADMYDWEELHHIHCVARAFFTKPTLDKNVMGSFIVFQSVIDNSLFGPYDFMDLYQHRTICFRFRDVALVCVLNDSCACMSLAYNKLLARITGALYPLQLREIMARLGYLNLLLKDRPRFFSEFNNGEYTISAAHPDKIEIEKPNAKDFGDVLFFSCKDYLKKSLNHDNEAIIKAVQNGRYTFLFHKNGRFIKRQLLNEIPKKK